MNIRTIKDLIGKSISEELQIPEFQREYVWEKDQVKLLIDSLYRNYTISSILIWKWKDELARRRVGWSMNEIVYPEGRNDDIVYLLDGQQRTTTLVSIFTTQDVYRRRDRTPIRYQLYIDVEDFDPTSEEWIFERLYFDDEKIENPELGNFRIRDYWFENLYQKFWLRYLPLVVLYDEEARRLFRSTITEMDDVWQFFDMVDSLKEKILGRSVHVISQEWTLEQVLDIFERINTKNTRLNIFDIMVAKTYRIIGEQYFDLRNYAKLVKTRTQLSGNDYFTDLEQVLREEEYYFYNDDKELLFTIMLFLQEEKIVKEREILQLTTEIFMNNYMAVNRFFRRLIDELENFKIQSGNYNKFKPIIKFFAVYLSTNEALTPDKRRFLKAWFWNTLLYNRYSGAQNERIQRDFDTLTLDNYLERLTNSRARTFNENISLDAYYNQRGGQLFLALELLMLNIGVRDFYSGVEVNRWTANQSRMELHHIFPENSQIWKKIKERGDNMINNIANLTPLTRETNNRFISNKNPSVYIRDFRKEVWESLFQDYLKTHLITEEMIKMLEADDFDWFIQARTKLIYEKIKELTN